MALFKKVACFTDIHFGLKSNSASHLRDCEEFVDWFIQESKIAGCETAIFLGDWSHNRNSLNLFTLDSSLRCLEKLGAAFEQFYWFPGNHDLFYKDKRDIHSSAFGRHIPGVTVVDGITALDDVTLVPWLVGDEWKTMKDIKTKYVFGHFELPKFFMNAMVQMPDHGELRAEDFNGPDYIFSGHFHKRQENNKVIYIIDNAPTIMKSKMHIKVNLDIDISYEEANFIKETFIRDYDIREISLIQDKTNMDGTIDDNPDATFESVDQIVTEQLINIDSDQFDKNTLLEIYNNL